MTRIWDEEDLPLPEKVTQPSIILIMQMETWETEKTPEELNEDGLPVLAV